MGYVNPFSRITGLAPERIDQGVDFSGSGPILAIGNGVVIETGGGGWPGGPFMSYRLTDGPDMGKVVYIAENIVPVVHPGQNVAAGQPIANMFQGGTGIETGWADASGFRTESSTPQAGSIVGANLPGGGANPTAVGKNFDELLASLGVPRAPNFNNPVGGILPGNFGAAPPPSGGGSGSGGLFDLSGLIAAINPSINGVTLFQDIDTIFTHFLWFFKPENWVRIISGIIAIIVLALGTAALVEAAK